MSTIKYQLIPVDEGEPIETKSPQWIGKVCFLCTALFVIVFYCLSSVEDQLESSTQGYAATSGSHLEISLKTSTLNSRISSRLLDILQDPSTMSPWTEIIEPSPPIVEYPTESENEEEFPTEAQLEESTTLQVLSSLEQILTETTTKASYPLETASGEKYFVNSPKCQMRHPDPFASNIRKIYRKHHYIVCDRSPDMITVNFNDTTGTYRLHKNEDNSTCCYKRILRVGVRTMADHKYKLLPCEQFPQDFQVPTEVTSMITECRKSPHEKVSQTDAFSFVHPGKDSVPALGKRPSVLLWGIDSVSRMNFQLTMPLMYEYLNGQHWNELQGYNKMGDNTFPNLMALLTGFNKTYANERCRPSQVGGLDACPLVWKDFKAQGYTTAFAEDWSKFSTFDFMSRGFRSPPTDVYGRPMILALEKELRKTMIADMPFCMGRRSSGEYIYDLGVQFTRANRNRTFFGMFWTNTFSHNDFSMPSAMDARMVQYMRSLDKNGIMDNTIIIFFSDHGSRFGQLRKLDSGFLEERLPFFYMRVPRWIREKYPEFMQNLRANRNRLTSPYDIHATLKHILRLDTPAEQLPRPEGCPTCHSVFEEVDSSRNCSQAGIDEHWCGCDSFTELPSTDTRMGAMSTQLVEAINEFVAGKKGAEKCHHLRVGRVVSLQQRGNTNAYLLQLYAQPGNAFFEATVNWDPETQRISIRVPSISRLDYYSYQSKCTSVKETKKFCIC
ncbi:uncharacterized protein LOC110177179 [Drosophila serrata]|uniref:uncharacterized protein LOC110177179 n=1 Tax=Drosophila serrata TaxID=7274 RepID=UPI000A1D2EA2|nr:uncharacterized protein LOC110177179 [Drosophila serrata]